MVDGTTQIVLTPETEWERIALKQIKSGALTVYEGEFYECQGGYWRGYGNQRGARTDTILRIDTKSPALPADSPEPVLSGAPPEGGA